jgi:hypothetical protein
MQDMKVKNGQLTTETSIFNDISVTTDKTKCANWIWQGDGVYCSICHHKLQTTGLPRRCPHCYSFMV